MSTCNRLNLQTLGSQPTILPKILPNHCQTLQASISFGKNKVGGGVGPCKITEKTIKNTLLPQVLLSHIVCNWKCGDEVYSPTAMT